ncbi:MAG: hypothetical protein ABIK07_14230 [Planctomycetota bacterium]
MSIFSRIFPTKKGGSFEPIEARIGIEDISGVLETRSPTWVFIRQYAEREVAALRERNDKALDADQTAAVRGQIKALKRLLSLESGPATSRPYTLAGNAEHEDWDG